LSWRKKNTERKERETVLLWMFCFYHGVTSYFWLTVACLTIRLILKIWFIVRLKKTSPPCYYQLFRIVSSLNILFKVSSDRGENVWIGKLFPAQLVIYLDQSLYVCVISSEKPSLPAVHFYAIRCWVQAKLNQTQDFFKED